MRRSIIDQPLRRTAAAGCGGLSLPVRASRAKLAPRQIALASGVATVALLLLWIGQATAAATESLPLAVVAMAFAFLVLVALWSAVAGDGARR